MNIFITGGLGFIGSNFAICYSKQYGHNIFILDNHSYSANLNNLPKDNNFNIINLDITNYTHLSETYEKHKPEIIFNFAAQTHVDNSINDDGIFISTNIVGTYNILKCIKKYGGKLLHISTDEVFGSLQEKDPSFTEKTQYNPNNPYSATKAASDHLVRSYVNTHKVQAVVTNCSNNYGPRQHKEKFIPTIITKAKNNELIPIYGNGENVRDWLFVEDHCDALVKISNNFISGERYNIGGGFETTNIELAQTILDLMGKPRSLLNFVKDRSGHDFRYSINSDKIKKCLGWNPKTNIREGLLKTLEWYDV